MTSPTRSETALIRPFIKIEEADIPLAEVQLVVGSVEYPPGAVVLADDVQTSAKLVLKMPLPQFVRDQVAKTAVPAVDCGIVVLATARSHRASRVLLKEYLKPDSWPQELILARDEADLVLGDRAGFTLTVAVVLLHDLTPEPLRPHMAGTWLARREFTVSPEREETSFSPEELTDEIRAFHNLPGGVLRYIHVGEWQEADVLSDEVHVYLESEVLNLLLANPVDSSAIQMQIELAIQATETVAVAIARDLSEDGNVPSSNSLDSYSAAKRFYENVARILGIPLADVLGFASQQPELLRAHLEAAFKMQIATAAALKEK